ncbi:hypothetical protein D3C86_1158670 [compost metagenome]
MLSLSPADELVIQGMGAHDLVQLLEGEIIDVRNVPDDAGWQEPFGFCEQRLLVDEKALHQAVLGVFAVTDEGPHEIDHPFGFSGLLGALRELMQAIEQFSLLLQGIL